MKTLGILVPLLGIFIFFAGCTKDEVFPDNYIKYNGEFYAIENGLLANNGNLSADGANQMNLRLLSNGFKIEDGNKSIDVNGIGDGLSLLIYTGSATELMSGTYVYNEFIEEEFYYNWGTVFINYNTETQNGEVQELVKNGDITVSKSGDIYDISLNLIDENNTSWTGHYKGTLKYYNGLLK
jgi:predicted heme/steroid binding protein